MGTSRAVTRRTSPAATAIAAVATTLLAACGAPTTVTDDVQAVAQGAETAEYRSGVEADVYLPDAPGAGRSPWW